MIETTVTLHATFRKSEKVWTIEMEYPNGDFSGAYRFDDYKRAQDFMDGVQFALKNVRVKYINECSTVD